jgi:hypothetical protein
VAEVESARAGNCPRMIGYFVIEICQISTKYLHRFVQNVILNKKIQVGKFIKFALYCNCVKRACVILCLVDRLCVRYNVCVCLPLYIHTCTYSNIGV